MNTDESLKIWNAVRDVPEAAKKPIPGGRLKGKTDISPIWRYQTLTKEFGPAGIGWKVTDEKFQVVDGANGEKAVFCTLHLWVKFPDAEGFSEPIPGQGGSMFVVTEKGELYTNNEAYKMAYTDAISVACKQLGFGADVYWQQGGSKYQPQEAQPAQKPQQAAQQRKERDQQDIEGQNRNELVGNYVCADCGNPISRATAGATAKQFGRMLCPNCAAKVAQK